MLITIQILCVNFQIYCKGGMPGRSSHTNGEAVAKEGRASEPQDVSESQRGMSAFGRQGDFK